jgi:hypothetical protein
MRSNLLPRAPDADGAAAAPCRISMPKGGHAETIAARILMTVPPEQTAPRASTFAALVGCSIRGGLSSRDGVPGGDARPFHCLAVLTKAALARRALPAVPFLDEGKMRAAQGARPSTRSQTWAPPVTRWPGMRPQSTRSWVGLRPTAPMGSTLLRLDWRNMGPTVCRKARDGDLSRGSWPERIAVWASCAIGRDLGAEGPVAETDVPS